MAQRLKHLPAMQETWVQPLVGKIPWRRNWQPTTVFLPGKSHGWRSLVAYGPWVTKSQTRLSDFTSLPVRENTWVELWEISVRGFLKGIKRFGFVLDNFEEFKEIEFDSELEDIGDQA